MGIAGVLAHNLKVTGSPLLRKIGVAYPRTSHHSGHLTLFGVRVALNTVACSSRLSRRFPIRASAASTIQGCRGAAAALGGVSGAQAEPKLKLCHFKNAFSVSYVGRATGGGDLKFPT